jgi:hypothetical protein
MQQLQHGSEAGGVRFGAGRVGDEMIMIGEHGPGFELPAELSGYGEQAAPRK